MVIIAIHMSQFIENWGIFLFTVEFSKVIIKRKELRGVNMKRVICLVVIFSIFVLTSCQQEEQKTITVLAAASLKEPLEEMKQLYEEANNVDIQLQFSSSGKLAKQIEQGAHADVFISADEKWMTHLQEGELIEKETVTPFLYNSLVLIQGNEATIAYEDVQTLEDDSVEQIAIGHPETVPAGTYAQQFFKGVELWDDLQDKFVYTNDVRQALTYVETGNVDVGVVYKTDALLSDDVEIIEEIDGALHDEVVYPIGMTTTVENKEAIEQFIQWLLDKEANEIKKAYGFEGI